MTAATIDEAVRRVLSVGGDPKHLGGVDNFCWPTIEYDPVRNPDGKYKAAQLVRANWALRDCCLRYGIPLLSGKDSMYVDGNLEGPYGERRKVSGPPTLLFTVCSVVEDVEECITMDAKRPGDLVYVLGETRNELGGGEYYQLLGAVGLNVPRLDMDRVWPAYPALHRAVREGLVASCRALSRGGLAVHAALVAMAGELGMEIRLDRIPSPGRLTPGQGLYSESCGRFLLTIAPENKTRLEAIFSGIPMACVGTVTDVPVFRVTDAGGKTVIREDVRGLKESWNMRFGGLE
jgi:phosphoribosylformylglycinamidine synthase